MNVGLIFTRIGNAVKSVAGNGIVLAKKHAPELMIASGITGFVVTVIETVHATNKTNDILEIREEKLDECTKALSHAVENQITTYTAENYEKDVRFVKKGARWDLMKVWAPVATTGVASIILVLGGYRVLNGRYVATAAAYKTLEAGFDRYRQNVVDEFGRDTDWRMAHSIKAEEYEELKKKQDELKRETAEKNKSKKPRTQYSKDINNQILDSHSCEYWKRYWIPQQAIQWVQQKESELQDMLNSRGHVFLNEAYDKLGMPRTVQGSVVGWIKTPRNNHLSKPNLLSLGYANDECPEDELRRILSSPSNEETYLWITPNCDGVIYQLIDKPWDER